MGKFTAEEIQIAKAVDLVDLAEQIGIPLKRKGRFYQAVGMDSVMIFNRSSWCRFSQGVGGSTINFLEYFRNMDFVAVSYTHLDVYKRQAYCLESMKASPPTSDYVANEFESNPELQKVLYYGYGGPGEDVYKRQG